MNLIKSTGTFGFYTIISRILGYLRDILIAIFLGTSLLADVFFVAFRIPNTFRRLFAEGTFNAAFVPSYTSQLSKKNSNSSNSEIINLQERLRLILMAKKLFRFTTPIMCLAIALGLLLWLWFGIGLNDGSIWMYIKSLLVVFLILYHLY